MRSCLGLLHRRARALTLAASLPLACHAGCGSFDPAVPYRLPDSDWALGISTATVWDEAESVLDGHPLVGIDASYLDDVFGLHAGVRVQGEGQGARLSGLVEATAWYLATFGVGVRAGHTISEAGAEVPDFALDITFLLAVPIPVWKDCRDRGGALFIAPYVRPGFRLTGNDPDPDDVRGFHELGITLRWTSFAF
jgi:hypothetical protein